MNDGGLYFAKCGTIAENRYEMLIVRRIALEASRLRCARWTCSMKERVRNDTIFALSTAQGRAGVGIIRVSGPDATLCVHALSKQTNQSTIAPRIAEFRKLYHPITKEHLDDAVVLHFPEPKSFTGEDVIEFQVHGSPAVISGVLQALSTVPRCRIAEPGEFTERAFENQKMNLMQVEALADLLSAETESQRSQALRQLSGRIGETLEIWQKELIHCLAYTEAMIDFGDDEDDVTDASYTKMIERAKGLQSHMKKHLNDGRRGELLRNGIQVAIIGPPNAGKSSLLNHLAQRPAAIVSSIAGTTRDIVRVPLNLKGYAVILCDTAGIRETDDLIEKVGVTRARECADEADICVLMVDGQLYQTEWEDLSKSWTTNTIIVCNKSDLIDDESTLRKLQRSITSRTSIPAERVHLISCLNGSGIDALIEALGESVQAKVSSSGDASVITRERHRQHLEKCINYLQEFIDNPHQSEFAAEHLRRAVDGIGRILGRVDVEQVLDVIFEEFCIGK
uniref:tRNA modification GTPase GTPBP3 putative n=1 Tax=Albugo laibachii Nc14 TaxID=890382 RepID=F0WGT4_9STRA|nr:tRNA modification GTPase GTPBP3 putative [Albugo laibachii Nc14]|eukprot:CCA20448.1 tRNA modification GTPase GTPBP3 putative [Albugo laibachii Nc14]